MRPDILKDRIAFVTGGESGIGAACAAAMAEAGAAVAILYHADEAAAARSCDAVRACGRRACAVKADVRRERDVEHAFDVCAGALGAPDILVNSAGVNMARVRVADMSAAAWRARIDTDLTGCFFTARRFIRDLRAAKRGGALINITSIHAAVMRAGGAAYDAAKGGQKNLTETLALETAELGVTVNAIAPGMILTAMNERALEDEAYRRALERNIPLKRAGRPEEVAAMAVFLASPEAAYVTGATITIDGGLSLALGQGA